MQPVATPYKNTYLKACLVMGLRHGLKIMISIKDEKVNRQAVIPSGPNTGKRYLAIDALDCNEIIEIKIIKTGQDRLNMPNYLVNIIRKNCSSFHNIR